MDAKIKQNLEYYADYFNAALFGDLDENIDLGIYDIDEECIENHCHELDSFFQQAQYIIDLSGYSFSQACHDFYFTRCGHGVGFWENDHCNEEQGKQLTEIAESFGPVNITVKDDTIYLD